MFKDKTSRRGILRSESALTSEHIPEQLLNRSDELNRISDALQPLSQRRTPENLLVYGPAGVGKTTCVKHVFERLDEETAVKTVYINCWQYNTRPSLLTELLIQLGYPAPRKGKPVDELLSKIREWLDKKRGAAVALDEFDQLDDQTKVVYDLQLLNQDSDSKLGLVMISNQCPTCIKLDPRSRSRLSCQTLEFKPYTASELEDILWKRVEKAFRPGSVPDEVVVKIAEEVAEKDGDCRQVLEILLRLAQKADQEDVDEITLDMLQQI